MMPQICNGIVTNMPQDKSFLASQKLITKDFEGLDLNPYKDSVGKITIGYGRNLDDKGISRHEADYLLENDITEAIDYAETYPFFATLNDARKHVVVDMMFNLGPTRFGLFRSFIDALNAQDYEKAALQMIDSLWYKQVRARAVRLVMIMRSGVL